MFKTLKSNPISAVSKSRTPAAVAKRIQECEDRRVYLVSVSAHCAKEIQHLQRQTEALRRISIPPLHIVSDNQEIK